MTNLTANQITGSFVDAIELNKDSSLECITPSDMRSEIRSAFSDLTDLTEPETVIYYASWNYDGDSESTHFVLFPKAGRGGACSGGDTEWYDATTMDAIEDHYRDANEQP